jgi:methyltransferase (TIGR00027 family)
VEVGHGIQGEARLDDGPVSGDEGMVQGESLIRNISDTALWAAVFRAQETERRDALFRDPLARRLAGDRGVQIAAAMPMNRRNAWAWVMRTYIVDQYLLEQLPHGVDMVVNLAAGLDTRPYRMALPPRLRWVEVDLPALIDDKERMLAAETPVCELERVRLDLSEIRARRALFDRLGREARKVMILTEGLLIYLSDAEVGSLAEDLAAPRSFQLWATDVVSPGLIAMMRRQDGGTLARAGAPFKFAPLEGPEFFVKHGWRPVEVRSTLKTAAKLKRLPLLLRFLALFPQAKGPAGKRPWSGICLFGKP